MIEGSSIAFYQQSCLPSPSSSTVSEDVNSYSTLMDTSTTGRRTRIQPSSLPLVSLKRKAADQPLSATQNLISEALVETSPAVNQILPNIMSLARVIQRSRAVASGSSQHQEATTSEDFTLPPTCTSTRRDEPFVLYDGSTDRGVRVIIFATSRNMETLSDCRWNLLCIP